MSARLRTLLVLVALVGATLAVYADVRSHEFVAFDDDRYVTDNPEVSGGLTAAGVGWAFTAFHSGNWHPLTWLSHMLDVELFGLDAGAHKVVAVLLHALNAVLLLVALRRATGELWASAAVAALFALHPLRVESVAWVAERKDLLAGLFWMLALVAYVRYARRPGPGAYLAVAAAFAGGLLAKPMVVTLPCVLLLLDFWPLGRWRRGAMRRLVVEKVPLFLLAAASSVVTFFAQGTALRDLETLPLRERWIAAPLGYLWYLGKTLWPADLACLYPHPAIAAPSGPGRVALAVGAALVLAGITALAVVLRRRLPPLLVGWLWFLGTLVPVIGLVQVGSQATADRYAYLPTVGLYLVFVWGAKAVVERVPRLRPVLPVAAGLVLAGLAAATFAQVRHWRDGERLWRRAVAVTRDNFVAQNALGLVLLEEGRAEEAEEHFREAVRIKPDYLQVRVHLARLLARRGELEAAAEQYRRAIWIRPRYAPAHNNLGGLLLRQGKLDLARRSFESAVEINPRLAEAHDNLGMLAARRGDARAAVAHFRRGFALRPPPPEAAERLAWILASSPDATLRDGAEAQRWARYAAEASGLADPSALATLAAACAEAGDFAAAVRWQRRALELASGSREALRRRLALFEAGKPLRE